MWERGIWLPESPIPPLLTFFAWCMCSDVGIALGRGKDLTDWIKVYSMCVCWGSWLMLLEGWKDGWVDREMDGGRMSDPGPVEGYENSKTQRKRKKNIRVEDMETEEYWAQIGMKYFDLKESNEDNMFWAILWHESVCKSFGFSSFGLARLCRHWREHMLSCVFSFRRAGGDHKYWSLLFMVKEQWIAAHFTA